MYVVGDKFYQVVKDDEKLVLTVDNGNVVNKVISEKAKSVAFPLYKNDASFNLNKFVVYVEDIKEDEDDEDSSVVGSNMISYDLSSGEKSTILGGKDETIELFGTSGDCLFYTHKNSASAGAYIYCKYLKSDKSFSAAVKLSDMVYNSTITAFAPASSDFQGSIIFYDGTNTYFRQVSMNASKPYDISKDVLIANSNLLGNLVTIKGNKIYYNDSGLNSIVFTKANAETQTEINVDTPVTSNVANYDVNGSAVFYLVERNDHAYLYYTNSTLSDATDKDVDYHHFVGKLIDGDETIKEED